MSNYLTPRQVEAYRKVYFKIMHNRGREFKFYLTEEEYAIAHALYIENEPADPAAPNKPTVELIILNSLRNILSKNGARL